MAAGAVDLDEQFTGTTLDPEVWFPYYLPHWSSRAESAATWSIADGELRLTIAPDQGLWCADLHEEPLRVSCIQSGSFAGPVGTTTGQQPFREGLRVREEQPTMWGYTPLYGHVEVRTRATVTARSMFAFWMSGIEDDPARSGEVCVAEVFGSTVGEGTADVDQAPDYPMQLMIGVFDFPARAAPGDAVTTPELVVSHVRGHPLA